MDFKELGITKNDTLLIQANVVHWVRTYKYTVQEILELFLDTCGTVVFPTFNTGFAEGKPFDIRSTPSQMGVLSETARRYKGAIRSGHPMYSFVALGHNAHLFNVNNFSGYGKDSPFAVLRRLNAKIAIMGLVNNEGNTIFHHVEEMCQVPYRFYKLFRGQYTDRHGQTGERIYAFYCNGGVHTLLNPIDDLLWKEGLYRGCKPYEGHGLRVIDMDKIYEFTADIITSGRAEGLLYDRRTCGKSH